MLKIYLTKKSDNECEETRVTMTQKFLSPKASSEGRSVNVSQVSMAILMFSA